MEVRKAKGLHVLLVPYPAQGHINPQLQFGKRLTRKGVKVTLAATIFVSNSKHKNLGSIQIDPISDGYDHGGYAVSESTEAYYSRFQEIGARTLANVILKHSTTDHPISCVVYDSLLFWVLDVAKNHGLPGAAFFTQPCAVNNICYYMSHGLLSFPTTPSTLVSIPGMPFLELEDLPSFATHPAYLVISLNQFSNIDKADFIFVNTTYELEKEAVKSISGETERKILTIGPAIPFNEDDKAYGLNLFHPDYETCTRWLKSKPPSSVIYASLGSIAIAGEEQIQELARGLLGTNSHFMWVITAAQKANLPKDVLSKTGDRGIIVEWSPQLQVLEHEAVGCFLTHCGWNSTFEALLSGVPMVGMPQFGDQMTNAKLVEGVWRVGRRVKKDKEGIVRGEEIEACVRAVMNGERANEMRENAKRLSSLVKAAISRGGSSDRNIDEFVSKL